jgi:HEAT repeat protein
LADSIARLFQERERGTVESPLPTVSPAEAEAAEAPGRLVAAVPAETTSELLLLEPDVSAETPSSVAGAEVALPAHAADPLSSDADRTSAADPEAPVATDSEVALPTTSEAPISADSTRTRPSSNGTPVSETPVELTLEDQSPLAVPDPFDVPPWAVREVDQRSSPETAAATLEQAVRNYLWGPDPAPKELASRIEELCLRLTGAAELEPVVGAVERLALGTEGPDSTALQLARRILTPQVANALAAALGASVRDGPKRDRLSAAIVRLGAPMVPAVARLLTESTERTARRAYIDVLSALGEVALPALRELAGDSRWFVVRNAILLLREHGEPEVGHISAALQHDDPRVRKEALLALAHMGVESAGPLVASKLADPDSDVRKSAAMAAGAVRSSRVVKPLLERLAKEGEDEVVESILLALGQIGDAAAVPAIEKRSTGGFFQRPHSSVRVAAYRALAAIGTPHARKRVNDAVNDRDPVVREAVERLIRGG